jgi:hypothetical protein
MTGNNKAEPLNICENLKNWREIISDLEKQGPLARDPASTEMFFLLYVMSRIRDISPVSLLVLSSIY